MLKSCVFQIFVVPLYTQMTKNVLFMRKILSLLTCVLFAMSISAETTNVAVSMYRMQKQTNGVMYQLLNENMSRMYVFPIENLPEGATDVEYGKTYTLADMNQYSYWLEQETYSYALFTSATFTATKNGEGKIRIDAQVTDQHGDTYILLYDEAALPELPHGGTYTADTVVVTRYKGEVEYALETQDPRFAFVFDFPLAEGDEDIEPGVEYVELDLNLTYSLGYFNFTTYIRYASVSFVKTLAEDGSFSIAATVVDEDGYTWHLTGSKAAPPDPTAQHIEYDTPDVDFDYTFSSYDLNLDNLINGSAVLTAYDTENMRMVYLHFWTRMGVELFGAGVYPIDYTQNEYTVNASSGVQGDGMTPSFVGTLIDVEGTYYPNQLWLLVAGTVTVREDGVIIVEGKNSYGKTVEAVLYPDDYQAVNDVRTDALRARKVLEKGQILIIQQDRKFTIMGSPVY